MISIEGEEEITCILERSYLSGKSDFQVGTYVNLLTESSISFSKGILLKKLIDTREEPDEENKGVFKKQRYLQYTVLFTTVCRSNFN